jgi:hypothetical protein
MTSVGAEYILVCEQVPWFDQSQKFYVLQVNA